MSDIAGTVARVPCKLEGGGSRHIKVTGQACIIRSSGASTAHFPQRSVSAGCLVSVNYMSVNMHPEHHLAFGKISQAC